MSDAVGDLFEIQEKLRRDSDGSARRDIEAALDDLRHSIKRRLDAGVAPDEFRKLSAVSDAAAAASEVVAYTWGAYHKR